MLFTEEYRINADHVLIHIHVPLTDASAIRELFIEAMGKDKYFQNYNGEISQLNADQLAGYGMVAGHFAYGIHQQFDRKPIYLSIVRNPIDRYIYTYAAFLSNPQSRLHKTAMAEDINSFLRLGVDSPLGYFKSQFNNLQCRLICGEGDFNSAREFIDNNFFLVCSHEQVAQMLQMLALNLGLPGPRLALNERVDAAILFPEKMQLSEDSIALLLEREKEDLLLFHYVEQVFSQRWLSALGQIEVSEPAHSSLATSRAELIPPQELRFMGETDQGFLPLADQLSSDVLKLNVVPPKAILDIGCGYGRVAYGLRRANYSGSYTGFDILERQIKWLQENFNVRESAGKYAFHHFNTYNERYNPDGCALEDIELPFPKASFDCLVSLSVFTHMYEEDLIKHIRYLKTFICAGGQWIASFFILPNDFRMDSQPVNMVYPMRKQVSPNSYISDLAEPLRVIAYTESFLHNLIAKEGLEIVRQLPGNWLQRQNTNSFQDWLVLRRTTN